MKFRIYLLIIILLAICTNSFSFDKHTVRKFAPIHKPRIHPYVNQLQFNPHQNTSKRNTDNNKLLVILVDFQEESPDDPLSTGNGKFMLTADPAYRTQVGSPPHNQEYFEANLEALRFYYLAASQNTFDLQYDVWPKTNAAYTLSHSMSYYNPPGAGSDLFLSRMEEYFKEAFELADAQDPSIDFSIYGHFMIIHAGSDWQHDILGDTPSDLPSFYIKVAPGKEAIVDNGQVSIKEACNVPSTISQDFDSFESDGYTYYTGYGALNSVMAHEFGHSMGLVDLYNTRNFSPMVGQFDIMDSGGSGLTEDSNSPGVLVEGELPCLPGAFSRELMFGELFKQMGLYRDIDQTINQYNLNENIQISASSQRQLIGNIVPNIYRIPLNENEYLLIENRSVDPDGDGNTSIKGSLNGRVALYPTPGDDINNTPSYEYDYFLPSFVQGVNAYGGGLLVWHIDNKVLYQTGITDAEGNFISNFEKNTVNYIRSHRGVSVIEADGLDDLGNDYSMYWTGTPYEYFHQYKPHFDSSGQFLNWTTQEWRPTLNSESTPPLFDFLEQPSFYGLSNISQPNCIPYIQPSHPLARMSFRLSAGIFSSISAFSGSEFQQVPLPVINSNLASGVLPVWEDGTIRFYFYDPAIGLNQWSELIGTLDMDIDTLCFEPIVSDIDSNGYKELIIPEEHGFYSVEIAYDIPDVKHHTLDPGDSLACSPIFALGKIWLATSGSIYSLSANMDNSLALLDIDGGANKLAADDNNLILQQKNNLLVYDPVLQTIIENYQLPESFTLYEPVVISTQSDGIGTTGYILISDNGNIYKCSQGKVISIFHNNYPNDKLTNIAISKLGLYSPVIIFGLNDKLYAITLDGTLLPQYPVFLEDYHAKPYSHLRVRHSYAQKLQNESEVVLLTLREGGYLAFNPDGSLNGINSIVDMKDGVTDRIFWNSAEQKLLWFFNNSNGLLLSAQLDEQTDYPFYWSGYRNGQTGFVTLSYSAPGNTSDKIDAYVFPNPVSESWVNVRIENPLGKITLHVFDITGKLLYENNYSAEAVDYKDIPIDVSKYSSGIYIAVINNRNHTERCKFAVQK